MIFFIKKPNLLVWFSIGAEGGTCSASLSRRVLQNSPLDYFSTDCSSPTCYTIKKSEINPLFIMVPKAGLAPLRFHAESYKTIHWIVFLRTVQVAEVNKKNQTFRFGFLLVPKAGLEPAHGCPYWILSPARLPFHHFGIYCYQRY